MFMQSFHKASTVLRTLKTLSIEAPKEALEALATYNRVTSMPAPEANTTAAAHKILNGEDPTEALAQATGATLFEQARDQAKDLAERQVIDAVRTNADLIMAQVRDTIFTPAIESLTAAAKIIAPHTDLGISVGQKDIRAVEAIMNADTAAKQIEQLIKLREDLYPNPAGRTHGPMFSRAAGYTKQREAFDVNHGYIPRDANEWLTVIQAGAEPWFPTYSEYKELDAEHQQSNPILDQRAANDAAAKAARQAESARMRSNN